MMAKPAAVEEIRKANLALWWEDNYCYTLMVNYELTWEEAVSHYLAHGWVCTNPDCGKRIEDRWLNALYCRIPCRDHAYWLRKKRRDDRLRRRQYG